MNIGTNRIDEGDFFLIEDVIVPYYNVEITHANDNKVPKIIVLKKVVVWLLVCSILAGLYYM